MSQVEEKIKEVLCESLGVDEDEIKPNATLMGDLGAESIDFLDIMYRCEKKFNIKIGFEPPQPSNNSRFTEVTVDMLVRYIYSRL